MNTKIVTYTGKVFDLLNPTPDMVCIEDIAHALSQLCRYTGHTSSFYSVAQHCVLMTENEELPGEPLAKLLHDAAETYIGDIASPWKQLLVVDVPISNGNWFRSREFRPIKEWERKIQTVIGLALGVNLGHSAEVEKSDNRMYPTETRDLMPLSDEYAKWKDNLQPVKQTIFPWRPEDAEDKFLYRYHMLKEGF